MRRKSDRSNKKSKTSPEKKIEKPKRRSSKRRKQSSSTENESAGESSSAPYTETMGSPEKALPIKQQTPTKEPNLEDKQDQVWQVKTAESSGDSGEIQKLKICLKRPLLTPETPDKSPRLRRKLSRTTSSSDGTPSVEGVEERKKSKHRSKRSNKETKDNSEKNIDSQGDEHESEQNVDSQGDEHESEQSVDKSTSLEHVQPEIVENKDTTENNETPVTSENNENNASNVASVDDKDDVATNTDKPSEDGNAGGNKVSDGDAGSNKVSDGDAGSNKVSDGNAGGNKVSDGNTVLNVSDSNAVLHVSDGNTVLNVSDADTTVHDENNVEVQQETDEGLTKTATVSDINTSSYVEEVENMEIDSSKCEKSEEPQTNNKHSSDVEIVESDQKEDQPNDSRIDTKSPDDTKNHDEFVESKRKDSEIPKVNSQIDYRGIDIDSSCDSYKNKERKFSIESEKDKDFDSTRETRSEQDLERSISKEEPSQFEQTQIIVSRKRRWGARPGKVTSQKSLSISTDVLKEIIPDVKPVEFTEVIEVKKSHKRNENYEKVEKPILPKIVIDNTEHTNQIKKDRHEKEKEIKSKDSIRKISIVKDDHKVAKPPSPSHHKISTILYIRNLVRPFTLPQLKNLLQRTGRIVDDGFWIDKIKSQCYVIYETEDQAVETRHALHGVTWPVSNPKTLFVDFSTKEAFDKAKANEETNNAQASTIPGTVEDWLREQDLKRERGEINDAKPWERRNAVREWDVGKGDEEQEKERDKDRHRRDEKPQVKRRHRTPERIEEPARKFKKKEEEAPAKLLDDLFRKTRATPCIYWLPLSAETIAVKEEQRRQHMAEYERRMQESRRPHPHRR